MSKTDPVSGGECQTEAIYVMPLQSAALKPNASILILI